MEKNAAQHALDQLEACLNEAKHNYPPRSVHRAWLARLLQGPAGDRQVVANTASGAVSGEKPASFDAGPVKIALVQNSGAGDYFEQWTDGADPVGHVLSGTVLVERGATPKCIKPESRGRTPTRGVIESPTPWWPVLGPILRPKD